MTSYRPARVGELIQAELAQLLLKELKDPRLELTTISHVEVAPDFHHARVYISRMGSAEDQENALAGFQRATGFIRGRLGKRLKLRYVPKLEFVIDTGIAYGVRISSILNELVPQEQDDDPET
ncbi:MAG: hypothetical protein ETSY1_11335 [Candidatus Entotheonella factor]|uniref:Ribosome-binding factor A n=1 Tax=Entotheonella factor TaxID=1429438 RepID=W4LR02_ENTF1|nr:MAG: hypothetical protein ETSY1_11335 [Candidatus Entotheonella factor]